MKRKVLDVLYSNEIKRQQSPGGLFRLVKSRIPRQKPRRNFWPIPNLTVLSTRDRKVRQGVERVKGNDLSDKARISNLMQQVKQGSNSRISFGKGDVRREIEEKQGIVAEE